MPTALPPPRKSAGPTWLGFTAETLFVLNIGGFAVDILLAGLTSDPIFLMPAACFMFGAICFWLVDRKTR